MFVKGIIIGFSVAAPVGPIGILTIRRSLTQGKLSGFVTGMGAATADTIYGMIAGFGLTAVSSFLMTYELWMKLIGGSFLLFLGIRTFLAKPTDNGAVSKSTSLLGNFISTFFLTITNPATILSFLAIFAGLGLGTKETDIISSLSLVGGVMAGSSAWWLFLSTGVGVFRSKMTHDHMRWINRLSGVIMTSFGIWALLSIAK